MYLSALVYGQYRKKSTEGGQKMFWKIQENGRFTLENEDKIILQGSARAFHADGRYVDSRSAKLAEIEEKEGSLTLRYVSANGLVLTEYLWAEKEAAYACCALSSTDGSEVECGKLVPLAAGGAGKRLAAAENKEAVGLFGNLFSKMLQVPFDNDMWLRYEAVPLRPGRKSYDLTVLFDEDSREGILIGAEEFDVWKNALICSAADAQSLEATSGVADEGTHDLLPHGTLIGTSVESARFTIRYGRDYRELLEAYGQQLKNILKPLEWKDGVPFGFNSWAGLANRLNADIYEKTGVFLTELREKSFENNGVNYDNLDAMWQPIGEEKLVRMTKELHARGQRAGIYDAPFAFFGRDIHEEIPGVPGHEMNEILLHDTQGEPLPRVDGAHPLDLTHPLWREMMRVKYSSFIQWGYDYIKVDFMTHGGTEGIRYDKTVRTGRQALTAGYRFLCELLSEEKAGKPFFISLSIAPLFPCGFGHARRFSCDAFGTYEDIAYILNAQTYSWWTNDALYAFNDPDHIVLLKSFGMEKDSTEGEARARYTAAAIAGGVMMLSDDYDRPEAMNRARMFATNPEVNAVARSRVSFRPVDFNGTEAAHAFTGSVNGEEYLAVFSWNMAGEDIAIDLTRAGLPETTYRDLWSGKTCESRNGILSWHAESCDAILLKAVSR